MLGLVTSFFVTLRYSGKCGSIVPKSRIKELFAEGKVSFGFVANLPDPSVVEIAGYAGFDFVIVDMEHTAISVADVQALVRSAEAAGIVPLVRVPEGLPAVTLRVLETGARGIVFPHVGSPESATAVVRTTKYPPEGSRGSGSSTRAGRYGLIGSAAHQAMSNESIVTVGLIEDVEAFEKLESIVKTDGLDVIWLGAGDLATEMGFPGQLSHPEVRKKVVRAIQVSKSAGKPCMVSALDTSKIPEWIELGASLILLGESTRIISRAFNEVITNAKKNVTC